MYAIIEESGGQRRVHSGDEILIDLFKGGEAAVGEKLSFDRVLLVGGDATKIGAPYVSGAAVDAEVVEPSVKGDKVHIFKFRPKKWFRRKTGHRQRYTKVRITGIRA